MAVHPVKIVVFNRPGRFDQAQDVPFVAACHPRSRSPFGASRRRVGRLAHQGAKRPPPQLPVCCPMSQFARTGPEPVFEASVLVWEMVMVAKFSDSDSVGLFGPSEPPV